MSEQHQLPPGVLFRSFLTVAIAYILSIAIFAISAGIFLTVFAPQKLKPEEVIEHMGKAPIYWSIFAVNLIGCFVLGWMVARVAPFAQFAHSVFLAVLVFVSNLQQAMGQPPGSKWIYLVFMVAFPIAILVGGNLRVKQDANRIETADEELL